LKYFIFLLFFTITIFAKSYDKLEFSGEGIDFLVGDFATSNLYKVIGKEYPPFYTPWREDHTFSDDEIDDYKARLKDYCESLGYFRSDINITAGEDSIKVILDIKDQIKVKSIKVHPDKEFKNAILFKENSPFNTANFTQSKKRIERYMLENGHPKYGFDAKAYVDLDKYEVNLDFYVDKNGTYRIGKSTISGRKNVDEEIIREAFEYQEGDIYDIRKIEKSYDNLYELGVYDFITLKSELDGVEKNSSKVPIKLDLVMGETKFLKGSVGYSTNEGARGGISWIDKNFFGNLKVFDIGFKVTEIGYEAYNIFYNPRIILPVVGKITFENDINYKHYRYETFDETTILNRMTIGKRAYGLEHYFGLLTEYSEIDAKVAEAEDESGNYFINSLFYRLLVDKRDSMIDAKNGYYISLYLEKSMKGIGSDLDYFKSIADLRYIKSVGSRWTFATKLRVGRIDADVPIFKRFFTGGANTNRGYDYRDIGVKDSAGVALGGVSLVDMMVEARYRVWQKLWVTSFYDSSLLNLKPDNFDDKYYGSYGVGMRYNTVIGPVRVDFGFPQDRDDWTFHISIGQVF
jgi:translocation and assembly module TamA